LFLIKYSIYIFAKYQNVKYNIL